MEGELDQLKLVLRSLVVSSPTQVDAQSLLRDYRSMIGSQLPFAKFGYRNPIAFLRERCSDCFLGSLANPDLTLIVPDALRLIDRLVQSQKVPSNNSAAKSKEKRRSVLASAVQSNPDLTTSMFRNGQRIPNRRTPVKENTTVSNDTVRHNGSQHTQPQVNSKERQHERRESDSRRMTASSSSRGPRRMQLEELKRELKDLVVEHPDGVYCADLMRVYRQRNSDELNFIRFGFTSVLSLASSVNGVRVTHDASQGDWLLSDAMRAPPALRPAPLAAPSATPRDWSAADPEDALPGIPYAPEVFPPDCMGLLDSIPELSLAGIKPEDELEVSVGEVYSPSHFWLQRLGDEYNIAMETVMDEMNLYYNSEEGRSRQLLPGAVRVGFYCSSCYDGDWHRSLIVRVLDADTVKVRHVDYGTVDRCAMSQLRLLRREWAALPAQALRGRLARVSPPGAGRSWSRAAALYFLKLVRERRLFATVSAVDPQENALEVILTDTSTDEDMCISGELVRSGHAESRSDEALGMSECYLFPHFSALESGATLNFAEIHAYLQRGIALEFVDEYRQHVPACLPPANATSAPGPSPANATSAPGPSPANATSAPGPSPANATSAPGPSPANATSAPGPSPPTDGTRSTNEDDAPAETVSPAPHNLTPLFPTQNDEPAHTRRNVPVCADAPQLAQQYAPRQAMRYYPLHPAPSMPNPLPNRLVYLTHSEVETAAALCRTAPYVAHRFLLDKLHRALVDCPGPSGAHAAMFGEGPPPGFQPNPNC